MTVRRLCVMLLLLSGMCGCSTYKDWFGAAKSADAEAPVQRNLDFDKKSNTQESNQAD